MHDDFRAQVASSAVLKQRFDTIAEYIIDAVRQEHGVQITADDVVQMPVARLSTYAASDDYVTGWREEAVLAPAVRQAKERERLQAALESGGDSVEARQIANRLAEMDPQARLAWARSNNVAEPAKKQAEAKRTPEEKAALIRENDALPTAQLRMAHARKHNL